MGAQKNYFGLIYAILIFKSYWPSVRSEKSEPLIDALSKIDFDENDKDWDTVPSNKVLAESCGLSRTKVNQLIRKMYADILFQFNDNPPLITKYEHYISIGIPWDDRRYKKRKTESDYDEDTWVNIKLPFTPRIGDNINLEFIDRTKYTRGCVYNVEHTITGNSQNIYIQVHPFDNEYSRWQKLKEHHDRWQ